MRYDTIAFILAVFATLFQLLATYTQTGNDWILVSVSVICFIIIGLIGALVLATRFAQKVEGAISARLPQIEIFDNANEVAFVLERAVSNAQSFIYTTGSASRNPKYLEIIEAKVKSTNLEYSRIFYKRHVHIALKESSKKIIDCPNVDLSRLDEDHYGYFTITEKEAIIFLPGVTSNSPLAIRVTAQERLNQIRQKFERMAVAAVRVSSVEELEAMAIEFQPFGN